MDTFRFTTGSAPLLISIPHVGTYVPERLAARMTAAGQQLADTDWHLDRLYDVAGDTGASVLAATHSRYVIDLNRDPSGTALYPGADNTELVPSTTFAYEPIYRDGQEPDDAEVTERVADYWRPYHDQLAAELARIRERHGLAVLFDAHSIRSRVARFFSGRLPDLNLGTRGGGTADGELIHAAMAVLDGAEGYTSVLDGRFRGGYITAAHGRPADRVHAVQLEMAQCCYMDENPPFAYDPARAARIQPILHSLLHALVAWAHKQSVAETR